MEICLSEMCVGFVPENERLHNIQTLRYRVHSNNFIGFSNLFQNTYGSVYIPFADLSLLVHGSDERFTDPDASVAIPLLCKY